MGSYMIYQALCKFTNTDANDAIANLVQPPQVAIKQYTLQTTLNAIYPFIKDALAIKDISNFDDYRRHYPERYEWQHFDTDFQLPNGL
jgi:erythronate-4-phosphate dehydrogenase